MAALGLVVIALGTGGIKPCVSAFGGDQFTEEDQVSSRQLACYYCNLRTFGSQNLVQTNFCVVVRLKIFACVKMRITSQEIAGFMAIVAGDCRGGARVAQRSRNCYAMAVRFYIYRLLLVFCPFEKLSGLKFLKLRYNHPFVVYYAQPMYVCVYVRMCVCMYVRMYMYILYMYVCMCVLYMLCTGEVSAILLFTVLFLHKCWQCHLNTSHSHPQRFIN